ncbi:PAS domain-containing protein [Erythrobacter sp.]|uniref:PAS domain-containing protein n=1 Tax=Erythrobacter sp. TaxID=1042 RepID=UPI0025E3A0A3|nr:PAS domain-containing protein [Erythrobacter sp.]
MTIRDPAHFSPDFKALFDASPLPLVVVRPPDWTIIAVNAARLRFTQTKREEQIGRRLLDVFPDDPDDPDVDGASNLSASLERVVATRTADTMPLQRYALRTNDGQVTDKWLAMVNTPVLDLNGNVESIIHQAEDVTEVHRLRSSEAQRAAALDVARLGTFEWEPASQKVLLDARSREIFGFAVNEPITAEQVFGRIHPDDLEGVQSASFAAASQGEHLTAEYRILLPDGTCRTVISQAGAILSGQRMVGVFGDVTERSYGEQALRESEERFRNMAEHAPVAIWVTDPDGYCTYLNREWFEFTGQTPEEAEGFGWLNVTHPDDKAAAERAFVEANAQRRAFRLEYRLRRHDGTYRWAIDAASPRLSASGDFLGYIGSVIDIHKRREAEERLALREEQLRLALEVAEIGEWDVDHATGTMFWPARVKAMFGITADVPVTLDDFFDGVHPEDRRRTREAYDAASDPDRRALYDVEYRTVGREDGKVRWVAAKGRGLFDSQGRCYRVIGTAIDVTERKAAEDQLLSGARMLRVATEIGGVGLWDWDVQTDEIIWSDAHFELLGYAVNEVTANYAAFRQRVHEGDVESVEAALKHARETGQEYVYDFRVVHPGGEVHWISARGQYLYDADGKPIRMLGAMIDTTERRRQEEWQKLLVEELQHRVRNLISMIRGMARQSASTHRTLESYVDHLIGRLQAMGRTQAMLTRSPGEKVNLSSILEEELLACAAREKAYRIEGPVVHLSPQVAEVLTLAIHELATNSVKYGALGDKGYVKISWTIIAKESTNHLALRWQETGVSAVTKPSRVGFGRQLIEQRIPYELQGTGSLTIHDTGVLAEMSFPLVDGSSVLETGIEGIERQRGNPSLGAAEEA